MSLIVGLCGIAGLWCLPERGVGGGGGGGGGRGTLARPCFGTVITPAGVQRGGPHSLPISPSAGLTLDRAQGNS